MVRAVFAVLALFILSGPVVAETVPAYDLSVSLDPSGHTITGKASVTLPPGEHAFHTRSLSITALTLDGEPLFLEPVEGVLTVRGPGVLDVSYRGVFEGRETEPDMQNVGVVSGSVISEEGISLLSGWYPVMEGKALFRLTAFLPEGFLAVSEAEEVTTRTMAGGVEYSFLFPHPLTGINLTAGRYVEFTDRANGTDIYAYFFPEDAELAETYLRYTKDYIRTYEEMLGPFPFKRFSVVENFLPTGYSMPTYTLLGSVVVRLPFIVETSLGHEITHQWFGNYVEADYEKGNWVEGLTTYLADHFSEERKGRGAEYRKKVLLDYRNYVHEENEIPVKEFVQRRDFATRAVGYGKCAMLFHMLRREVGGESFLRALRILIREKAFEQVSWTDIQESFERNSGRKLGWFFDQWVLRKGLPDFTISKPRVLLLGGTHRITFTVSQRGEPYRFLLPVEVFDEGGGLIEHELEVKTGKESFEITMDSPPALVVFDRSYDMMRKLHRDETPPVISNLSGSKERIIVVPEEGAEPYEPLITLFEGEGFTVKPQAEVQDKDLRSAPVVVLGVENPVLRRLYGGAEPVLRKLQDSCGDVAEFGTDSPPEGFVLVTLRNPLNPETVLAVVHAGSAEETRGAARKIYRYGNYSVLYFLMGRNLKKSVAQSEDGMRFDLSPDVLGLEPREALGLAEIIERVMDTPLIYVGEAHTSYRDHKIQLEVIRRMHEAGKTFAVGMEMFQRPFQEPLDDFIAGRSTEKELLRDSEYFTRWKFNYHLYREILDYAKTNGIPVVALNQKAEIIKKVSREGLDGLTEEEREHIPPGMDMSDYEYRTLLEEVFAMHREGKDFENFYQSQVLWDETMAHSIAGFLRENPEHQMLIIAGKGHVMYGSGIPRRAYRLTGKDYVILISSPTPELEPGLADYVLFSREIPAPSSPLLGVKLDVKEKRVIVMKVTPGSPAGLAGMKEGDVIVRIDDIETGEIGDIKLALFGKESGESVRVKIRRKRFLFGDKEMELEVTFP
jgi:uncharacterized iron-regulated protein